MRHIDFPLFELAVLKGAIEHNDTSAYFGSTMSLTHYTERAQARGWVEVTDNNTYDARPTEAGRAEYTRLGLDKLPQKMLSRAYTWDWSHANEIMFPTPPKKTRKKKGS